MTVGYVTAGHIFSRCAYSSVIVRSGCRILKGVEQFGTIEKGAEESAPKE
jgi:hypothetical protein